MEHLVIQEKENSARPDVQTMRVAVLEEPGSFVIEERPAPIPDSNQVLVRLEGCGVCGSNLPVWEGRPWFTYPQEPGAPGHEGWGIVESVGEGVPDIRPGDRVAVLSYHAFATHDLAASSDVIKLPATLDGRPFPGEPLACAINVMRRAKVAGTDTVAVVGVGFLGSLLTMLAVGTGARVVAVSRRPYALEIARSLGAVAVSFQTPATVAEEASRLAPDGFDVVIEAVGSQAALDVASALTKIRGRLVVAGYHQDGLRSVNMQDWNWKGIDVINAHERDPAVYREGMRSAVEMAATGAWTPDTLITNAFELDELNDAMRMMQERPDGFLKAVLTP